MTRDDWFRRTSWSSTDEAEFFARLRRSRTAFHKAQYVRIQAHSLAETGEKQLIRTALALLDRLFADYPDPSQLTQAHLQAAHCYEHLGNLDSAIKHFRLSLIAKHQYPNLDAGTDLEFSWFIAQHKLTSLYQEALANLETAHLALPVQLFKASVIRAFVAEAQGDTQAASRHAREALKAAGLERSQFRYHQHLGLVGTEHDRVIGQLDKIAAAEQVIYELSSTNDDE